MRHPHPNEGFDAPLSLEDPFSAGICYIVQEGFEVGLGGPKGRETLKRALLIALIASASSIYVLLRSPKVSMPGIMICMSYVACLALIQYALLFDFPDVPLVLLKPSWNRPSRIKRVLCGILDSLIHHGWYVCRDADPVKAVSDIVEFLEGLKRGPLLFICFLKEGAWAEVFASSLLERYRKSILVFSHREGEFQSLRIRSERLLRTPLRISGMREDQLRRFFDARYWFLAEASLLSDGGAKNILDIASGMSFMQVAAFPFPVGGRNEKRPDGVLRWVEALVSRGMDFVPGGKTKILFFLRIPEGNENSRLSASIGGAISSIACRSGIEYAIRQYEPPSSPLLPYRKDPQIIMVVCSHSLAGFSDV